MKPMITFFHRNLSFIIFYINFIFSAFVSVLSDKDKQGTVQGVITGIRGLCQGKIFLKRLFLIFTFEIQNIVPVDFCNSFLQQKWFIFQGSDRPYSASFSTYSTWIWTWTAKAPATLALGRNFPQSGYILFRLDDRLNLKIKKKPFLSFIFHSILAEKERVCSFESSLKLI